MKAGLQKPLRGSWNPTCLGATERKTKWTFFLCSKAFLCRCVFLLINKSGQRRKKHTHTHSHSATVCFQPRETTMKNKNMELHFPSTGTNLLNMPTVGTEAIHSIYLTHPSFPNWQRTICKWVMTIRGRAGLGHNRHTSWHGRHKVFVCNSSLTYSVALYIFSLWISLVDCNNYFKRMPHTEFKSAFLWILYMDPSSIGWSCTVQ